MFAMCWFPSWAKGNSKSAVGTYWPDYVYIVGMAILGPMALALGILGCAFGLFPEKPAPKPESRRS